MARWSGAGAALVLAVFMQTAEVRADDLPAEDVRAVIAAQIAAFQADDKTTAYSFAAPSLRQIFPNPDLFMGMVRNGYQPVYRPRSVTYGRVTKGDGGILQEVFVVGPDGEAYTALYTLQQQPDGSWKISACRIARSSGASA